MVGRLLYLTLPLWVPTASRALTILSDSSSATSPKTTCLLLSQPVTTVVMKNWEPLLLCVSRSVWEASLYLQRRERGKGGRTHVFGPALAMESMPGLECDRSKFSSANFSP